MAATSSLILNLIVRDESSAGLSRVQKGFTALTAAVGAAGLGLTKVVSSAADFDKTIRQVGAAAQVPAAGLKSLSDLALKMGADTSFSAKQAADAMLELAKGGMTEAQIRGGVLKETLTLAAAGSLELGSAAGYMSNALHAFGLQASDAGSVAAALAGGANASTASVESLGIALGQVGPGARLAGLSLAETTAVLAAFDNAGIKGSDAGTSLKTMLTRLIPTTDEARAAMADLGLKFTDASGQMLPITNIAEQLRVKMSGLSDAQRTAAMSTIFGSDATRAATILMQEGSAGLGKYIAATSDLAAAQRMAATNTSGAAGAFEQFKSAVETLGLRIGLALLPAVESVTRAATGMVNGLGVAFDKALTATSVFFDALRSRSEMNEFDGPLRAINNLGVQFSIFARSVTPLVQAAFNSIRGTAATLGSFFTESLAPSLANLARLMSPMLAEAVGAVATIFVRVFLPALRGIAEILQNVIGPALRTVTGFLAEHRVAVQALVVTIGSYLAIVKGAALAQAAWTTAMTAGPALMAGLRGAIMGVRGAVMLMNIAFAANPIGAVTVAVAALTAGLIYAYKNSETFRNVVNGAFNAVRASAEAVLGFFRDRWPILLTIIAGPFGLAAAAIIKHWDAIRGGATAAFGALRATFSAIASAVTNLAEGVFRPHFLAIAAVARAGFDGVRVAWTNVLRPVFSAITTGAAAFTQGLATVFRTIGSGAQAGFRLVAAAWNTVLRPVFAEIVAGSRAFATAAGAAFNAISAAARTVFRAVQAAWATVLQPVFGAIRTAVTALATAYSNQYQIIAAVTRTVFGAIRAVWASVLQPTFSAIRVGAQALAAAMQIQFRAISALVRASFVAIQAVWAGVLRPTFALITSGARALFAAMQSTFNAIATAVRAAFSAIRAAWVGILSPTFAAARLGVNTTQTVFSTAFRGMSTAGRLAFAAIKAVWQGLLSPTFDAMKSGIRAVQKSFEASLNGIKGAFRSTVNGIRGIWGELIGAVAGPADKVIGIIHKVGGALEAIGRPFGLLKGIASHIPGFSRGGITRGLLAGGRPRGFATGGVMPGYTPGRDNQLIAVGGGEAIMRPEWTRAVGSDYVNRMNAAARRGGVSGVAKALGLQQFVLGGIAGGVGNFFGGVKDKVKDAIHGTGTILTKGWEFLMDPVKVIKDKLNPILSELDGLPNTQWGNFLKQAPKIAVQRITDATKDKIGGLLGNLIPGMGGGGGPRIFNPGVASGLAFAYSQQGKPYIWGASGPGGYDCSGFMSAIANVIMGRYPYSRLFATPQMSGYPAQVGPFIRGPGGAFSIGVAVGNPGHTAGTINGVNVESRGGRGVLVGPAARGTFDSYFNMYYHLAGFSRGGVARRGDPPFDILDPRGKAYNPVKAERYHRGKPFDMGGVMAGRGYFPKYTNAPERVLSPRQTAAFESWMRGGGGETHVHVHNHGVMGSQMDVENWLRKSLVNLKKQGRI